VIDALGPSTIQPVAISKRVPNELRAAIVDVILELHTDPTAAAALSDAMVQRFAPVTATDYDDIRSMLAACESANFMTLR
jgi:ABC-type phosphate/phosphonate transport system substrate-binding protein